MLLAGAGAIFVAVLYVLLVLAGLDLIVTGALGHCPLYRRLGHTPSSLRGARGRAQAGPREPGRSALRRAGRARPGIARDQLALTGDLPPLADPPRTRTITAPNIASISR